MGAEAGVEGYGLFINFIILAPLYLFALLIFMVAIQILFISKKLNFKKQLLISPFLILVSQILKFLLIGNLKIQLLDYAFLLGVILAILLLPMTKWLIKPKEEKEVIMKILKLLTVYIFIVTTLGCSTSKIVNLQFELIQQKKFSTILPSLKTVKAMDISKCGKHLFISDGSIIGKSESDLIILNTTDLSVKKTYKISKKMSDNYPWSATSLALDQKNERLLFYNQFINLKNGETILEIDPKEAISRRNVCPEPLAISPNGKLGLLIIHSYNDGTEDCLSLYELKTGKLISVLDKGRNIGYGNACFINDTEVICLSYDGLICKYNLNGLTKEKFKVSGPTPPMLSFISKNLTMQSINQGKRVLLVGGNQFSVLDTEAKNVIYSGKLENGNALFLRSNKHILHQQYTIDKKTNKSEEYFAITDIESRETMYRSKITPLLIQLFIIDDEEEHLYAINYDSLYKFKIKK